MAIRDSLQRAWARARTRFMLVLAWVGVLWLIHMIDFLLVWVDFAPYGIHPREPFGLLGIFTAPFLHVGFFHLLSNTLPLVMLGWVLVMSGRGIFLQVAAFTALTSGLGAWTFGQAGTVHEGASGVLFGLLGFLLARGWFARRIMWSLVAMGVGLFYIGTLFSLARADAAVSWSAHFWGLVGGVGWAWWMYGRHTDGAASRPVLNKSR